MSSADHQEEGKLIHSSSPVAAGQRVVELVHVGDAEPPMIGPVLNFTVEIESHASCSAGPYARSLADEQPRTNGWWHGVSPMELMDSIIDVTFLFCDFFE
jgi:hypothetical protein